MISRRRADHRTAGSRRRPVAPLAPLAPLCHAATLATLCHAAPLATLAPLCHAAPLATLAPLCPAAPLGPSAALRLAALLALVAGLALGGCRSEPPPAPPAEAVTIPATEVKRGQDACKAYVDKACRCADKLPALKQPCSLARALPDALEVSIDVALNPESRPQDARQAVASMRGIVKECVEQLARLPAAGCAL